MTILLVLFLVFVFQLAPKHRSRESTHDPVSAHLIATKVSRCTSAQRTHQTTIALLLGIRVCGPIVLLTRLSVWVLLSGRVLVLRVGALLRKLLGRWLAGVLLLVVLTLLLVGIVIRCLLAVLESALRGRAVLLLILLWLLLAVVSRGGTSLLLGRVSWLLVWLLRRRIPLPWGGGIVLRRGVAGVVLLVVLVVIGVGHFVWCFGVYTIDFEAFGCCGVR